MPSSGDKSPYTEQTILMAFPIKLWMTYFKGQITGVFQLTARNVKWIPIISEYLSHGNKVFNIEYLIIQDKTPWPIYSPV